MILAYCFQHSANIVLADLRVYSQKICTAKEKIAQIYLQYLHVFPSLGAVLQGKLDMQSQPYLGDGEGGAGVLLAVAGSLMRE